jgi:hypothetical protein
MITKPVTFIVGAGASAPYGLPLGSTLYDLACDLPGSDLWQLLRVAGESRPTSECITMDNLQEFLAELREAPVQSIDAFLEKQQHRPKTVEIGRWFIAALMGREIATHYRKAKPDEDWLAEVAEHLLSGCSCPAQFVERTHLAFVTFNFDSVIENYLSDVIKRGFIGHPDAEIAEAQNVIKVIHVHGKLPANPQWPESNNCLSSRNSEWLDWMRKAPAQINIIHDSSVDEAVLAEARRALTSADIICFVGLHYHEQNLKRLDVEQCVKQPTRPLHGSPSASTRRPLFGSAYRLTPSRRNWVGEQLEGIRLGNDDWSCRRVLQNLYILRG